jgi:hypothetical protein
MSTFFIQMILVILVLSFVIQNALLPLIAYMFKIGISVIKL